MRPIVLFTLGGASLALARNAPPPPPPSITAPPHPDLVDLRLRQDSLNPLSVAEVLLTAFPRSFYEIAASNPATIPALIWQEFLGGSIPEWFANLPEEIRAYLIQVYMGATAPPASATPTRSSPAVITSDTSPSSSHSASTGTARTSSVPSESSKSPSTISATSSYTPTSADTATSSRVSAPSSSTGSHASSTTTGSYSASASTSLSASVSSASQISSSQAVQSSLPTTTFSKTDATSFVTATITSSNLPPPAVEPTEQPAEGGLSRDSKIGVGVGVPIGLLAIAAILGLCFLRRRRSRALHEKETDPDRAPFVSRAQLYDESYGGYAPYGPYASLDDDAHGFRGAPMPAGAGPMAGTAATERHRRSLAPIDTNLSHDAPPDSLSAPVGPRDATPHPANAGAGGYTNLRSSPHRKLRRGSGASLRSIEEETDEGGDLAAAGRATKWNQPTNFSVPMGSPIERDPMDPPFSRETSEESGQQKYAAFRSGSLKHHRRSPGAFPTDDANVRSEGPQKELPHRPLVRRKSLSIGGGYRSLPSPHLQQPSQTYLLPRGEWLEDGEDLPPHMNRF